MSLMWKVASGGHDAYVLVHPERFPSNDWDVGNDEYAHRVNQAANSARRKIAVLDDFGMKNHENGNFQHGVDPSGWKIVHANPGELGRDEVRDELRRHLGNSKHVAVGGFHRDDCVPHVMDTLQRAGYHATMHDQTTLPYSYDEDYERYEDGLK